METVHAYTSSGSYNSAWDHLNNHTFVAAVRLTAARVTDTGNGYDTGPTYVQYTRVPRQVDVLHLQRALRDTLGGSNCRHEWDCCGCASRSVFTELIAPRRLKVTTHVSYNY